MSPRRLLVVAVSHVDEAALREEVRRHAGGESAEVHIVAPIQDTSLLQRLTGDVDKARAEAEEIAHEAEEAVEGIADVEIEVGDANALLAIGDALATFPADELIVVGDTDSEWLEREDTQEGLKRLGLPVTRLVVGDT
jgi:hypothetical protein